MSATTNPIALAAQLFLKDLDGFAADPTLKLGEGSTKQAALRLQDIKRRFAYTIDGVSGTFRDLSNHWLNDTPFPPDEPYPYPGLVGAPTTEQTRGIADWKDKNFQQFTQRELHRSALKTLYELARPIYHLCMEVAAPPPNPVPINYTAGPSIANQTLFAGFQALLVAIGEPHAEDLNNIEATLRDVQQPGVSLREHAADFASKINELHRLGRVYDTVRPNETGELFWKTIHKKYWKLVQDFLSDNPADHQRSRTAMLAYMLPRAWAYERSDILGEASLADTDEEIASDALAARSGPKKQTSAPIKEKVTTTLDLTAFNPTTLEQLGLKLVPIRPPKTDRPQREFANPQTNTDGFNYCWTHGFKAPPYGHNSADCRNPAEGHKERATGKNTMGGSTKVAK